MSCGTSERSLLFESYQKNKPENNNNNQIRWWISFYCSLKCGENFALLISIINRYIGREIQLFSCNVNEYRISVDMYYKPCK